MIEYLNGDLREEFHNPRKVDWKFKLILNFIGMAFWSQFGIKLMITCLGRNYNPRSAHYSGDKLVCAADLRSNNLEIRHLVWLANLNKVIKPYMDILIEDVRFSEKLPAGGNHIHVEINPNYWIKLTGMI